MPRVVPLLKSRMKKRQLSAYAFNVRNIMCARTHNLKRLYLPNITVSGGKNPHICPIIVFLVSTGKYVEGGRVQITSTAKLWSLVIKLRQTVLRDVAEIVRNIVLRQLAEKSVISDAVKTGEAAGRV